MHLVVPILAIWLVALSVSDIRERRLPNTLTLPALFGAVVGAATHPAAAPGLLLAAVVYGVAYAWGGCGGGDLKLVPTLCAMSGSLVAAGVLMVLAQLLTLVGAARSRWTPQAHGPPLSVAAALSCGIW
jgi:leader peptidase (prepilin peptidase)/N-methyltransferase